MGQLFSQIQIEGLWRYMAPKRNSETTLAIKTFKSVYWVVLVSSNSNIFINEFLLEKILSSLFQRIFMQFRGFFWMYFASIKKKILSKKNPLLKMLEFEETKTTQ